MRWYRLLHPRAALRAWRFRRALDRWYAELPDAWKALSDEEQAAEIRRVVQEVRRERAVRFADSTPALTANYTVNFDDRTGQIP